jgi:NADH:ubiquinone oxidoreductase subunit F (NADH-binding)
VARAGLGAELDGPLVTVVGRQGRTVLLTRPGETFGELVRRSGTSAADPPQAALVGGYGGTWLPWSTLADLEVTVDELHRVGASLGAGVVAPIGARTCPLVETAAILTYLAESSARQCGPCVFGLPAMAELFGRLARRRCSAGDLARLERYAAQVTGRGACHHPDGAVRMALSALSTFAVDVRRHQSGGACPGDQLPPALPVPEVAR